MEFVLALQAFIVSVLFKDDEYNFKKKTFNPIKVMISLFVIGNIWFTGYLVVTLQHLHSVFESKCSAVTITTPDIFFRLPEAEEQKNN